MTRGGGGGVGGTQSGERRIERERERVEGRQSCGRKPEKKIKTGGETSVHFLKLFTDSVAVLLVHFCDDAENKAS